MLHPAGRLAQRRRECSVSAAALPRAVSAPHTHTHTLARTHIHVHTHECASRPCAPPAAATCRLHLNQQKRGTEALNNARALHYAIPQVITTFAIFQEVTGEAKAFMPSPWIAFFFSCGLYPSRWSAAPQSDYSPPSYPGISSRHVALNYKCPHNCLF